MIPFNEAKQKISQILEGTSDLVIPTLGLQSYIRVYLKNGQIAIQNSRDNVFYIDEDKWNAVYQRRNNLPAANKNRTSQYGNPIWHDMPGFLSYIIAPYIPAVMRLLENQTDFKTTKGSVSTLGVEIRDKIKRLFETDMYETTIIKCFFR